MRAAPWFRRNIHRHRSGRADRPPAFMPLAEDESLAGFALRIERVEGLFETFFGGLPSVDGTAHDGFRFGSSLGLLRFALFARS